MAGCWYLENRRGEDRRFLRGKTRAWRAVPGTDARITKNEPHRRKMSTRWMPRRHWPTKDVPTRRNALGRRWEPVIQRSPNGATPLGNQGPTV